MHSKLLVATTAIALTACSPYVYEKEIKGFSDGVSALQVAYNSGLKEAEQDRRNVIRWQWIAGEGKVSETSDGCGENNSDGIRCQLLGIGQTTPAGLKPGEAEALAKTRALLGELAAYGGALRSISNAKDSADLRAAQSKVSSSLKAITTASNPVAGPVVGALVDALNWIGLKTLETQRFAVLKQSVDDAHPALETVSTSLKAKVASWPRRKRMVQLRKVISLLEGDIPNHTGAERRVRVDALVAATEAFEAVRVNDPNTSIDKMLSAHKALRDALMDNSRQLESVQAAISEFVDSAKAVKAAFEAIE